MLEATITLLEVKLFHHLKDRALFDGTLTKSGVLLHKVVSCKAENEESMVSRKIVIVSDATQPDLVTLTQ